MIKAGSLACFKNGPHAGKAFGVTAVTHGGTDSAIVSLWMEDSRRVRAWYMWALEEVGND